MAKKKFGEILVQKKIITKEQLDRALEIKKKSTERLGQILIRLGYITEEEFLQVLEEQLQIKRINLSNVRPDPEALNLIPEQVVRRFKAVPIKKKGDVLEVVIADPLNVVAMDDLRLISKLEIEPRLAAESEIQRFIDRAYGMREDTDNYIAAAVVEEEIYEDTSIINIVNSLIQQAVKKGASDIHIEPQDSRVRVRFRIDGLLRNITTLPQNLHSLILSRIKIMSQMDIAEKRIPQDGRINTEISGRPLDLRVSTLPTIYGEKVVLRLLDKSNMFFHLEQLGLSKQVFGQYNKLISRPYGMILVTGPTGSGKTTTLYATLDKINTPEKNIITIEDPVEYMLQGINQTSINPKAGLTFANGLRAILRQDPDVIMVGEIRDFETAQIAVQAANTGHLVFSTLHTNNAAGTLTRLLDMGVEPYLIASSVVGVLAQRLVRVICSQCKKEIQVPVDAKERLILGVEKDVPLTIYQGEGCSKCNGTGYKGRTAVTELLVVNAPIQKLIVQKASSEEIKSEHQKDGQPLLWQDAVSKVLQGITTVEEITRIT